MEGKGQTQKGRRLTGYPSGGFEGPVTKRWPFGQAVALKKPVPRKTPIPKAKTSPALETPRTPFPSVAESTQYTPSVSKSQQQFSTSKLPSQQQFPTSKLPSQRTADSIRFPSQPPLSQQQGPSSLQKSTQSIPSKYPSQISQFQRESKSPTESGPQSMALPEPIAEEFPQGDQLEPAELVASVSKSTFVTRRSQGTMLAPRQPTIPGGLLTSGESSVISLKRPSVVLPTLLDDEKYFHDLVKSGSVALVDEFLLQRPDFNINCTNFQGVTALNLAVISGSTEMVHTLLEHPMIDIGDCALHAIKEQNIDVLKLILEKQRSLSPNLEYLATPNSAEFPDNVTPLILAAEYGNYEIVGLLLDRGHIIPRPHKPRCFCTTECLPMLQTQDPLSVSSGKLQIYRALCNPAYLCQTTDDPILAAFKLSKELKVCGNIDILFRKDYYELSENTRIFAADLIDECRNAEEVEIILSQVPAARLSKSATFPRLLLALDYKQKEFVASPSVQQVLEVSWIGDWYAWKGYRKVIKVLYVIPRLFMIPFILIVLMAKPNSNLAKFYALPINKLLSYVATYGVFLVLVFIQSDVDKAHQTKESQPTGVEIFLVIFVVAFMWNTVRCLIIQGPKRYLSYGWNIYQVVMELLFLATFLLWLAATIDATVSGKTNVERKYWNYYDPELLAEGLFVGATIMAFLRILLVLQINYELGPLQVAIGKMTTDFTRYSVLMAIILLAFIAAMCKFYSYYAGMVQKDPDTAEESKQENSFTSLNDALKTFFWAIFGMSGIDGADVVIQNLPDNNGNLTVINEHHFTEAVGYIAFAVFSVLMLLVVVNMLIATMSTTFQRVVDNLDMEWAFGKTQVYIYYMNLPVLPPPFNIIPTTYGLKNMFNTGKTQTAVPDVEKGLTIEEKTDEEFHVLMSQLVQRYFNKRKEIT